MKTLAIGAAALICAACGGSASGTIHGNSFVPVDSVNVVLSLGTNDSLVELVVADTGGLCDLAKASRVPKNLGGLLIVAQDRISGTTGTAPIAAGTYTITSSGTSPGKVANAAYNRTDATCHTINADNATATSGSVTFTGVSGGTYVGSYDLTMNSGDHVTGSFSSASCPEVGDGSTDNTCG
jgi:hypothetical protein